MVYEFLGLLVESHGTWLLLQRLGDASKDSDIPKNVPFAFAINNRNTTWTIGLVRRPVALSGLLPRGPSEALGCCCVGRGWVAETFLTVRTLRVARS